MIKRVFRLTLRAAQGFIDSIFSLMGVPLHYPDCRLLSPLEEALHNYVLTGGKLHADDTPVPVLLPGNKKTGRLWTYVRDDRNAGSAVAPAVWFA